jgi:proteasome lid subunit RPN8/RPN11
VIEENKAEFFRHALFEMPREACGLLIVDRGRERLVICENVSEVNDQFVISPKDYLAATKSGEIVGVVHSHCNISSRPSQADRVNCEESGVEWHICSVPLGSWTSFKPENYKAPLVGREWSHGTLDCYSLIRDYYRETLAIEIPDFHRGFEWWTKDENLYMENYPKAGFFEVPMKYLKEHDVLLMQIHANVVNHGAVYLGRDTMLHHLNGRLSSREVFGGYYRKHTVRVLRHENDPATR